MGGLIFRPSIGAYFASLPLPLSTTTRSTKLNLYAFPALISLVLLLVETIYLAGWLPETKGFKKEAVNSEDGEKQVKRESMEVRRRRLNKLGRLHGGFLLFFSGVSSGTFDHDEVEVLIAVGVVRPSSR